MFRKTLLAASIAALITTAAHADPSHYTISGIDILKPETPTSLTWSAGDSLKIGIYAAPTTAGFQAQVAGEKLRISFPTAIRNETGSVITPTSFECQDHFIQIFCSLLFTPSASDVANQIEFKPILTLQDNNGIREITSSTSLSYVAPPFITPNTDEFELTCGMPNYAEITGSSSLSLLDTAQETALEERGYSIMRAGSTLTVSGVGHFLGHTHRLSVQNAEGINRDFRFNGRLPEPVHAFASVVPATVNLTVKAGETIDISNALRSANASLHEFPNVQAGYFSTINETAVSNASGVTSGSYADKGRIVATGTAFEGAGRLFSFEAATEAKSGVVEFQYSIAQRLEGPTGSDCNPWARTAQGRVLLTVDGVDDPKPETPVDPGTPTAGAKFMFRYPTPPMLNLRT